MIRLATTDDIPGIKTLWTMCFDDTLNYVDFFYDKIATPTDTLVYEEGATIASMLTMIPTELRYRDKSARAVYIYGAATHKKYRAGGMMTALLKYAEQRAQASGCSLCLLVPGEKYLFDYYKRRGYSASFNCRVAKLKYGMLDRDIRPDAPNRTDGLDPTALFRLRENCLSDIAHVVWRPARLAGILEDARAYGEHLESYSGSRGDAYAIYGMDGRKMQIRECLGTTVAAQHCLLLQLLERLDPSSATVQLPLRGGLFAYESETRLYGMAKPLAVNTNINDMDAYMNLMLD